MLQVLTNRLKLLLISILIALFLPANLWSQDIKVMHSSDDALPFPWAGGLDACQFGEIDLNMDGIKDLFVFDRRGNRKLCFINNGIPGEISYSYAPQYADEFPELAEWVILTDYDMDGREDIFTYSPGWAGMKVYRNTSDTRLSFTQVVYPYLKSFQGGGYVNIIATNADYPVIDDVDGDGDLDILTFWALGTFVELHKNQSIEKYGHADSLDYLKTDFCWGRIAEHDENNQIFLDTCLFKQAFDSSERSFRHRGATMMLIDYNGDGLHDLVMADVDYPNLNLLTNGGTVDDAFMVEQNESFPSGTEPVHLYSMPSSVMIDVNNDGIKDLIVSPFDPSPSVSENKTSIWLYLNQGTLQVPAFELHTKSFLQDQMIDLGSGAYPVFADIDGDGLIDLVAGNYGYYSHSWYEGATLRSAYRSQIAWYKNTGDAQTPAFELWNNDLATLSLLKMKGLSPAVADLNGDGLADMLVGSENGKLIHLEQSAESIWQVIDTAYSGIDAGSWSTPQLYDIDNDSVVDLLIGSKNGKIHFYKGFESNGLVSFTFVTDNLGEVNVTDFNISYDGYSTPHFFRKSDNELMLIVGSEQGKLFLFDQIDNNLNGTFREIDGLNQLLDTTAVHFISGMRSAAATHWFSETSMTLLAGNYSGGLQLFNNQINIFPGLSENPVTRFLNIFPNPANDYIFITSPYPTKETLEIDIFTTSGQLFKQISLNHGEKLMIDVRTWPQGLYILNFHLDRIVQNQKLIITKGAKQ
jgi:hypothetical protein